MLQTDSECETFMFLICGEIVEIRLVSYLQRSQSHEEISRRQTGNISHSKVIGFCCFLIQCGFQESL